MHYSAAGCALCACRYISDETPMHAYLNAAYIVNNRRKVARDVKPGPVVAIVGPQDCGKTSLTKIMLNYAIRSGWNPLLVETDVRHGMISVPGTLSAVQVRRCCPRARRLVLPACMLLPQTPPEEHLQLAFDPPACACKQAPQAATVSSCKFESVPPM